MPYEQIAKEVESAENWSALERIFIDEQKYGLFNDSLRHALRQTYKYHFSECLAAIYGAVQDSRENSETSCAVTDYLPGTRVVRDGIEYIIHGIIHGEQNFAKVHSGLFNAASLVCETNLAYTYKLFNAKSQSRIDEIKYCAKDYYLRDMNAILCSMFWRRKNTQKKIEGFTDISDYQAKLNSLHLDFRYSILPKHIGEDLVRYKLETRESRITFLRSLSQYDFLQAFAEKNKLEKVHGLYGRFHQYDIVYLLKNNHLGQHLKERYKLRTKISKPASIALPFASIALSSIPILLTAQDSRCWPLIATLFPAMLFTSNAFRILRDK